MAKGADTREQILQRAAHLFNVKGYSGVALSDVMEVTGLQKGGIYNHFGSKEQLAVEAFEYAISLIDERLKQTLAGKTGARERLRAFLIFCGDYSRNPPIPGGCPIMNTAIEHDDGNPELRKRSRAAMERWRRFLLRTVEQGIESGELGGNIDPEQVATIFIAAIEGSIMMSKLYRDPAHIDRALAHLNQYIAEAL